MDLISKSSSLGQGGFARQDIIGTVLHIASAAWGNVCKRDDVSAASEEPDIAGALYLEICAEKERRGLDGPPLIIDEASSRLSAACRKPSGWIDFKCYYSFDHRHYLGMECKRVSSKDKELAKKYVTQGITRFISGKYSTGHDWAAMVAFVIDGDTLGSVSLIQRTIIGVRQVIMLNGEWTLETAFGDWNHLYKTNHTHQGKASKINILHLFLSW